jgi:hypothetical protein
METVELLIIWQHYELLEVIYVFPEIQQQLFLDRQILLGLVMGKILEPMLLVVLQDNT